MNEWMNEWMNGLMKKWINGAYKLKNGGIIYYLMNKLIN